MVGQDASSPHDDWKMYRLARRALVLSFITGPSLIGLIFVRQHFEILSPAVDRLLIMFVLPCGVAALFSSLICHWWPCPRCKKLFFVKWYMSNDFGQQCQHCGLRKWASAREESVPTLELDKFWQRNRSQETGITGERNREPQE